MKSCPTCNRTFEDTMSFCLVDGSILSAPFDPNDRRHQKSGVEETPPPTLRYSGSTQAKDRLTASPETPLAPPETVAGPVSPPSLTREGGLRQTSYPEAAETAAVPLAQPAQPSPTSKSDQPAMKTIVAPPPQIPLRNQDSGSAENLPRATVPSARLQATSQPVREETKSSRWIVIGALVVLAVLGVGTFWLIQRNKRAAGNKAASTAQTARSTENKSTPPAASFAETVNGANFDMIFVKGGAFLMGSPASDPGRDQDEGPQAEVTVQNFHMGKFEVTQAQYKAVMNANPSNFKGDDLPVDSVSWADAIEFCRKLSQLTGRNYRLPTEAEWEYAARAGSAQPEAGSVESMAWYDADSGGRPHPVGQKAPNAFGLYDMKGNLWEWCQSKYKPYPYNGTDGRENLQENDVRVLRGGSYESAARGCRSTYRRRVTPQPRATGFRIVLGAS